MMFGDTREQHISLLRSSHQETPGLEHELTEIKRLRDEAYCTKQPKLFSFQFHGMQKQYHILIMRALTEDLMIHHYPVVPQLGDREWSVAWNHDQMLPIFHSAVTQLTQQLREPPHQYKLCCMYHQLGKSMMERMGGMGQKPCVHFFVSAGHVWEIGYGRGYSILTICRDDLLLLRRMKLPYCIS